MRLLPLLLRTALLCFTTVSGHAENMSLFVETYDTGTIVGDAMAINAVASGTDLHDVLYRFRLRRPGESEFHMVRDFSPTPWLGWVPMRGEGVYDFEVTARNRQTGEAALAFSSHHILPRVTGGTPEISPTRNELVFLYSAPLCAAGSTFSVAFQIESGGESTQVPPVECNGERTMNVYLAGLRPASRYRVQHTVRGPDGETEAGPVVEFETGDLSFQPSAARVATGRLSGVLYENRLREPSVALDGSGTVVWYHLQTIPYMIPAEPGGYFYALIDVAGAPHEAQIFRKIDLAGNAVLETNAARVNEQLATLGAQPITNFHHDARLLPDGRIMVLAATQRILTDVQGPGDVAVFGDMILVFDNELQVQWTWDAFDHMDPRRLALLDEICEATGGGGCPVSFLPMPSKDWVHGNSITQTPDGHIVYSARHQDWVVKIDFANGAGSGRVLWRLGKDGDFRVVSQDPAPWFSHQHEASFVTVGGRSMLLLLDNGNLRWMDNENAQSRGQLFELDEVNRTARLALNANLGSYSFALGSAQQLANGNFFFGSGITTPNTAEAVEVDAAGRMVARVLTGTPVYRSIRMPSMYATGQSGR